MSHDMDEKNVIQERTITLDDGTTLNELPEDAETAARITSIEGIFHLEHYPHPFPPGTLFIGELNLARYRHPMPTGMRGRPDLDLRNHEHPLPPGMTEIGNALIGSSWVGEYNHPLPSTITKAGNLYLKDYRHPLPAGITRIGEIHLYNYNEPLPSALTRTSDINFANYDHPLPDGITETGYLLVRRYRHPLPAGITKAHGLDLGGHRHPRPERMAVQGIIDVGDYPHPLPTGIAGGLAIPVIDDLDQAVLEAIEEHGIDTDEDHARYGKAHSIQGWHVHLGGEAGRALEAMIGTEAACILIRQASKPGMPHRSLRDQGADDAEVRRNRRHDAVDAQRARAES